MQYHNSFILHLVYWLTLSLIIWFNSFNLKLSLLEELELLIEKHSVHPVYGSYTQKQYNCMPWESCKKNKSILLELEESLGE